MPSLEPGYWVTLTLKPNTSPERSYVGRIQTVDEHGIRITLVDWLIGTAQGWDVYIPHSNVDSALVATPDHDVKNFKDSALGWERAMRPEAVPTSASSK